MANTATVDPRVMKHEGYHDPPLRHFINYTVALHHATLSSKGCIVTCKTNRTPQLRLHVAETLVHAVSIFDSLTLDKFHGTLLHVSDLVWCAMFLFECQVPFKEVPHPFCFQVQINCLSKRFRTGTVFPSLIS